MSLREALFLFSTFHSLKTECFGSDDVFMPKSKPPELGDISPSSSLGFQTIRWINQTEMKSRPIDGQKTQNQTSGLRRSYPIS